MRPALKAILTQLPTLDVKELQQVKDRVEALLSLTADTTTTATNQWFGDWIAHGIFSELKRRGLVRGDSQIRAPDRAFVRASREMSEFLVEQIGHPLKPVEQTALGVAVAAALAEYLQHSVPLSLRTMMQNVGKIPQALEASFPGYLASGMVGLLIKERQVAHY